MVCPRFSIKSLRFSLNKINANGGDSSVGRNHKNIKIQLNQRLDSLLRIGQKKQKENNKDAMISSGKSQLDEQIREQQLNDKTLADMRTPFHQNHFSSQVHPNNQAFHLNMG